MTTIYKHTYKLGENEVQTMPLEAELAGNKILCAKGENCVVTGVPLNVIRKINNTYMGFSLDSDSKEFLIAIHKLESISASQTMNRIHRMEAEIKVKTATVQELVEATKVKADHIALLQTLVNSKRNEEENTCADFSDVSDNEADDESEITVELNGSESKPALHKIKVKPNCRIIVKIKDGTVDEVTEEQN